ncbi:MAG TPA: hypothetical protein VM661_08865 [Candidatus Sulfotelmatobacter sp.]|jgi:hypothetical protein|nr:hypothetical protein [Candidatus Sulfotelmatobacter sp.]
MSPSPAPAIDDDTFDRFIDGLLPSPEEISAARHAAGLVVHALRDTFRPNQSGLGRSDFLVAGSIGKRTAIRPLPSVDLLYLLPPPLPIHAELPRLVESIDLALRQGFPQALVAPDATSVMVAADGLAVRVYPSAEGRKGFAFPLEDRWNTINPVAEMAALRLSDAVSGGASTRLLALLKAWRTANAVPLSSFTLELLVHDFLGQTAFADWPSCLSDFLAWARKHAPKKIELPGSEAVLNIDDTWHSAAEAAYWRCVLAGRHAASGDHHLARDEWRKLFGSYFAAPVPFNIWNLPRDLGA